MSTNKIKIDKLVALTLRNEISEKVRTSI